MRSATAKVQPPPRTVRAWARSASDSASAAASSVLKPSARNCSSRQRKTSSCASSRSALLLSGGAARHTEVDAVLQSRLVLRWESSPTQSLARARAGRSSVSRFHQNATPCFLRANPRPVLPMKATTFEGCTTTDPHGPECPQTRAQLEIRTEPAKGRNPRCELSATLDPSRSV